jgi:hypothetical protein
MQKEGHEKRVEMTDLSNELPAAFLGVYMRFVQAARSYSCKFYCNRKSVLIVALLLTRAKVAKWLASSGLCDLWEKLNFRCLV